MNRIPYWKYLLAALSILASMLCVPSSSAQTILDESGIQGGLVVHLGCGDGKLTAALHANDSYLVHGLDTDPEQVAAAREHVRSLGLYGPVSADTFDGRHLPYVDNLVNLIVADELGGVTMEEVMRVLAPLGVAWVGGEKIVKPWPEEIDEWTHFLHGADNNAVAKDTVVGPPRRIQWVSGPMWSRNHEFSPAIYGGVSSQGRLFYVEDEGPIGFVDKRLPDKKSLVARDAFNGTLLWKRPMKSWHTSRARWLDVPTVLQRRIVAIDDRLYVTLGINEPVSALNAATGEHVRSYKGTEGAGEILCVDGVLLASILPRRWPGITRTDRRYGDAITPGPDTAGRNPGIVALDIQSGKILWEKKGPSDSFSLCSSAGRTFVAIDGSLLCLELKSGKELWRAPVLPVKSETPVIAQEQYVVVLGKETVAFSTDSGKVLWKIADGTTSMGSRVASFISPKDAFVVDGLVWRGLTGIGLDPLTGQQQRKIHVAETPGHHHRCYMRKATSRYILGSKRGIEFLDVSGKQPAALYNWARGSCRLGVVPCNGLLYLPSNNCRCYIEAQMHGFYAMASEPVTTPADAAERDSGRLEKGPSFGNVSGPDAHPGDWPSYRSGPERSGATKTRLPQDLTEMWRVKYDETISPPIGVRDRVYLATPESHSIVCLQASDGALQWRFTAGGRIDAPPTYHKGTLLFGAADGWLYALDASSGKLRWRFRCAPVDQRLGAFGQLESVWRLHGSVLIQDNVAYVAAGRSSLVSAGIYLYSLDPLTGSLIHKTHLVDKSTLKGNEKNVTAYTMRGVQSDILVSERPFVCMRQAKFDAALERQKDEFIRTEHIGYVRKVGMRLYASSGLTDGSLNNRSYWLMGANYGNILTFDETATYGIKMYRKRTPEGRDTLFSLQFTPASDGYLLYRAQNQKMKTATRETNQSKSVDGPQAFFFGLNEKHTWSHILPTRVRAMALTQNCLLIAGPPDVIDPEDPLGAFEGRMGGVLQVLAKTNGERFAEFQLKSPPVFDGVIAAAGQILVAAEDGSVTCFAGRESHE